LRETTLGSMAPGNKVVRATFNGFTGTIPAPATTQLVITQEDAMVSQFSASYNYNRVTLTANITDISYSSSYQGYDAYQGDIRNARVRFINRTTGANLSGSLNLNLIGTDTRRGRVSFTMNRPSSSMTVGIVVENYYTRNTTDDDIVITNLRSAVIPETTEQVEVVECAMMIPNGFSPDGDGINDYFKVSCLDKYPDAKLLIYSGTSALLYEQQHYGNLDFWGSEAEAWWDGRYSNNGNKLAPGSYIYILDLDHGKKDLIKTGVVFINR